MADVNGSKISSTPDEFKKVSKTVAEVLYDESTKSSSKEIVYMVKTFPDMNTRRIILSDHKDAIFGLTGKGSLWDSHIVHLANLGFSFAEVDEEEYKQSQMKQETSEQEEKTS